MGGRHALNEQRDLDPAAGSPRLRRSPPRLQRPSADHSSTTSRVRGIMGDLHERALGELHALDGLQHRAPTGAAAVCSGTPRTQNTQCPTRTTTRSRAMGWGSSRASVAAERRADDALPTTTGIRRRGTQGHRQGQQWTGSPYLGSVTHHSFRHAHETDNI